MSKRGIVKVPVCCPDCQLPRVVETDANYAKKLWKANLISRCRKCSGSKKARVGDRVVYGGYALVRDPETGQHVLERRYLMELFLQRDLEDYERVIRRRGSEDDPFSPFDFSVVANG